MSTSQLPTLEQRMDAVRRLGVEVRAGVHTGEVEVMNNDIDGIAVHIGARVAAEAGPGGRIQIADVRMARAVPDAAKENTDLWTG